MRLGDQAGDAVSGSKSGETGWTVLATLMLATMLANVASVGTACVLTIKSRRLRVEGREPDAVLVPLESDACG